MAAVFSLSSAVSKGSDFPTSSATLAVCCVIFRYSHLHGLVPISSYPQGEAVSRKGLWPTGQAESLWGYPTIPECAFLPAPSCPYFGGALLLRTPCPQVLGPALINRTAAWRSCKHWPEILVSGTGNLRFYSCAEPHKLSSKCC